MNSHILLDGQPLNMYMSGPVKSGDQVTYRLGFSDGWHGDWFDAIYNGEGKEVTKLERPSTHE